MLQVIQDVQNRVKILVVEAREYLERTSSVLVKIFETEIQNADVREGLVV